MKKLILLIILFTCLTDLYSQCKFQKDETDEFTKKIIRVTKSVNYIEMSSAFKFSFMKVDSNFYLKINHYGSYSNIFSVSESAIIYLKLNNDSIIQLKCFESSIANYDRGNRLYYIDLIYNITPEQICLIEKYGIKKIRIVCDNRFIEKEFLSKSKSKSLMKSAGCILL